ncbi:uncharacterized protein LOC127254168 [Andrographis paniculata]|uniref:uncharacterized protein LOC127254168 n=1 Tax=Andrographis paniculata TaxID=175694 RepID=UPI0021E8529C|nr:uncharacterized protein LOC127254168 [Andrographis paniculata]
MKKSALVAASVTAASATAISASSSSSSSSKFHFPREDDYNRKTGENSSSDGSSSTEKFAPRFDGLRFIETLITAHR